MQNKGHGRRWPGHCLASACAAVLLVNGCAATPTVQERTRMAHQYAMRAGMTAMTPGPDRPLPITGFVRAVATGAPLVVYIEGDGRAWLNSSTPSPDPTPIDPVALRLAGVDTRPNVVYLARPGQFRQPATGSVPRRYWLSARFAPEVVDAYAEVVRALAQEREATEIELVGYSGGGAIAALLSARLKREQPAVRLTLRTVAANLDTATWTRLLRLSPLTGSLNPADVAPELGDTPQQHLIGMKDRQVPAEVFAAFAAKLASDRCVQAVRLDLGHAGPWGEAWREALARKPACAP